jgi:hypothetical protein
MTNRLPFSDEVVSTVNSAFLCFITESMHSAYLRIINPSNYEIILFWKNIPEKIDRIIIDREIYHEIKRDLPEFSFKLTEIVLQGDLADFMLQNQGFLINCIGIFGKYDFKEYDLEA